MNHSVLHVSQCHVVEIFCGTIETSFTEIPNTIEVTYFITLHTVKILEYVFGFWYIGVPFSVYLENYVFHFCWSAFLKKNMRGLGEYISA